MSIRTEDGSLVKTFTQGALQPWLTVDKLHALVPKRGYLDLSPRDPSKGGGPQAQTQLSSGAGDGYTDDDYATMIRGTGPLPIRTVPVAIRDTA